jgi:hypothetical protein
MVRKFKEKRNARGLVLVFKPVAVPRNSQLDGIDDIPEGKTSMLVLLAKMDEERRRSDNARAKEKAVIWSVEYKSKGVETKVDGKTLRRERRVLGW